MNRRALGPGLLLVLSIGVSIAAAQEPRSDRVLAPTAGGGSAAAAVSAQPANTPPGYLVGPGDVLSVVFWRDKDMSADVTVRPDGKISLPLLNEIQAAGYTPEQLRGKVSEAAAKFVEDPSATVVVKEIHSRNVFITGNVAKPATYSLNGDMNVLQLIAAAGGLVEYAESDKIVVIRTEQGKPHYFKFNYKDVLKEKNVEQNIMLRPGDTIVVP